MPTEAFTIKTRSTHPFALVKVDYTRPSVEELLAGVRGVPTGARIVGYAASQSPKVVARARRMGAVIAPVANGRVEVAV